MAYVLVAIEGPKFNDVLVVEGSSKGATEGEASEDGEFFEAGCI